MIAPPEQAIRGFDYAQHYRKRRIELTRRFRALKSPGRLYWRDSHDWRDWQQNAVAMYKVGNVRTWFLNWTAMDKFIEEEG